MLNPFVILFLLFLSFPPFPNSLVTNPCGFKLCKLRLRLSHVGEGWGAPVLEAPD